MERAARFYESAFELKLHRQKMGPLNMAWFPLTEPALSG